MAEYRIGHGFDVHRLVPDRKLILGGVEIPYHLGLKGHSDADVLIHAVCDAMLGALALGDIGKLFPDTDTRYEGVSSLLLLEEVVDRVTKEGYKVSNIDVTVVAEAPKLAPHIEKMRQTLCNALRTDIPEVSIKATTTEGLGFSGRGEGVSATCVVLLARG